MPPHTQELASTDSVYDTEKLSERIAKLSGGVAVIKVRSCVCVFNLASFKRPVLGGDTKCLCVCVCACV